MSDQGFFQRSINSEGFAGQSVTEAGNIAGTASVVTATTVVATPYTILLPDQVANAGRTVTVVNVTGSAILTVGVQSGDSLDGIVDGDSAGLAVALAFQTFVSMGSAGWLIIAES